jgi:hypothetical protein
MKYSLIIAGLLLLLTALPLKAEDRFENKGHYGFVVRIDMGAAMVQPDIPGSPYIDWHKWRGSAAFSRAVGLQLGGNVLLMYEDFDYYFTVDDNTWNIDGSDFSIIYYPRKQFYLQVGPYSGEIRDFTDVPGPFDRVTYARGFGLVAALGFDIPLSRRWSILPNAKLLYVSFDDFESKVVAFSIGVAFLP